MINAKTKEGNVNGTQLTNVKGSKGVRKSERESERESEKVSEILAYERAKESE